MNFNAIFDLYLLENLCRIFAYILIIWLFNLDVLCSLVYIILVFVFDVNILNASISFVVAWYAKLIIESRFSHLIKLPGKQLYDPIFGNEPIFKTRKIYKDWREDYENYGTVYRYHFFETILIHS